MSLKEIQREVDEWVGQYKIGYFKPLEAVARLAEEVGELAREINHRYGPKKKKSSETTREIGEEIADIIFTVTCLANSLDIDLDEAFEAVMAKLHERDDDRFEKK